jgi:hypothetical protein
MVNRTGDRPRITRTCANGVEESEVIQSFGKITTKHTKYTKRIRSGSGQAQELVFARREDREIFLRPSGFDPE